MLLAARIPLRVLTASSCAVLWAACLLWPSAVGAAAQRTAAPSELARAVSMQPFLAGLTRSEPGLCDGPRAVERSVIEGSQAAGTIVVSPAFTEVENLRPSTTYLYCLLVHNRQAQEKRFELGTVDLVGSPDPDQQQQVLEPATVLGTWIRPAVRSLTLQPGEQARIPYVISTPASLPGGSLAAAIRVRQVDDTGVEMTGARAVPAVLERIYLTLPGGEARPLDVRNVRAPRVLQRRRRELTYTARFDVRNVGTLTDAYRAELEVRGLGRTVGTVDRPIANILPGGAGRVVLTWEEVPWIGMYQPTAVVSSRAGDVTVRLPRLFVLPPMPYLVALLAALLLPPALLLRSWWRRRAQWRAYLEEELQETELLDEPSSSEGSQFP